jgi:bla regulator protein BlaR1
VSHAVLEHVWQSTLFVFGAWVLTRLLRRNGAHVRYAVWLAASSKFLVPFSLLALLGRQLQPYVDSPADGVFAALGAGDITAFFVMPGRVEEDELLLRVAAALWFAGFLALAFRWIVRWRRVRTVVRDAVPMAIAIAIPVRSSASLLEPGVVGVIRPVLLLPQGIDSRLTAAQLEAILKHELCHVRRHDNLTAALHMLVEAVFWFHPLVWWIGARLIAERERACDEEVVRSGSDPRAYAESILDVCRSYAASNLPCVAGVSGADLKTRLEAIMKREATMKLGIGKRLALGTLALGAVMAPVFVGVSLPVEQVRASEHDVNRVGKIVLLPGKRVKLQYTNVDVRELIRAMADAAQVNILVSDKVGGTVTLDLTETSWDHALDVILGSMNLVKHEKDGILFIEPASA